MLVAIKWRFESQLTQITGIQYFIQTAINQPNLVLETSSWTSRNRKDALF